MPEKKRSINQIRPKGESGAMPYSPQRDLANIYTPMLREVFQGLDQQHWAPHLRELFERYGVVEDDLGEAVTVFVAAHQSFIRDRKIDNPHTAFKAAGIDRLKPAVRIALFSRLGEVVMGGFFVAIRDITLQGQHTPGHDDFTAMIAAGREMARELSGHHYHEMDITTEQALADSEELGRILKQTQELVEHKTRELASTQTALEAAKYKAHSDESQIECQKKLIEVCQPILRRIHFLKQAAWYSRLWQCVGLTWDIVIRRKF